MILETEEQEIKELENQLKKIPDQETHSQDSDEELVIFDEPIEVKPLEPLKPLPQAPKPVVIEKKIKPKKKPVAKADPKTFELLE